MIYKLYNTTIWWVIAKVAVTKRGVGLGVFMVICGLTNGRVCGRVRLIVEARKSGKTI